MWFIIFSLVISVFALLFSLFGLGIAIGENNNHDKPLVLTILILSAVWVVLSTAALIFH